MIANKFQRKPERWWRGQNVLTTRELKNDWMVIPAGAACVVTGKYGGLSLSGPACVGCGVKVCVSKVSYRKLLLIDEVVEIERDLAIERAESETTLGEAMAVVEWNGRYLVIPHGLAYKSPLETIFGCGKFPGGRS